MRFLTGGDFAGKIAALVFFMFFSSATIVLAELKTGQAAPLFALKDIHGKSYELSAMKDQPIIILYFFDINSAPSQEGLLYLDELITTYKENDLIVWGVTRSDKTKTAEYLAGGKPGFPVLIDNGKVSDVYAARMVLPTVCIVGPDLTLLDYFQGGGKATESMLIALAERELQRRNASVAKAISEKVADRNPQNIRAASIKGYIQLKEGDLKAAENTFYNLSRTKGEGEILGKEGLSQVYAQKGEPVRAIKMVQEVEKESGGRAHTHVVKGDLLYSQDKPAEAEKEYRMAVEKIGGDPNYMAMAYNQLGRMYALKGDYVQSRDMYDRAVALDPYYVEATSNKGLTFERQGQWRQALEAYRRAQSINRNDPFANVLAAQAQRRILMEKDPDRRRQFETRAELYLKRYKEGARPKAEKADALDPWTSGELVVAFFEPYETGGLAKRDGFGRVLTLYMAENMIRSGRIQVVDPILIEHIINELKLNAKAMADPLTQRRLALAFGATLICRGALYHLQEGTHVSVKVHNIDDTAPVQSIEHQFASAVTLKKDLRWLNRQLLTTIMKSYPLKAYVVEVVGNQVLLNLGAGQGVVTGALFNIVEEKPAVTYKGKTFRPEPSVMATIEVVRVEDDFAYAHIKEQRRPIKTDDKLREVVVEPIGDDLKIW